MNSRTAQSPFSTFPIPHRLESSLDDSRSSPTGSQTLHRMLNGHEKHLPACVGCVVCASSAEFTLLPSWRPHAHKESLQPKERAEGGAPQSLP